MKKILMILALVLFAGTTLAYQRFSVMEKVSKRVTIDYFSNEAAQEYVDSTVVIYYAQTGIELHRILITTEPVWTADESLNIDTTLGPIYVKRLRWDNKPLTDEDYRWLKRAWEDFQKMKNVRGQR